MIVIVGTPGDRRVTMFTAACWPREVVVVPWVEVLSAASMRIPEGALVRIDSPGEDAACDALLRGPGAPTRVGGGASWYAGFVRGLSRVRQAVAESPGARLWCDVDDIAAMFDKRVCHARLAAAGVPVPPALPPVDGYAALRAAMERSGWARVFVKPAHGSSASGIIALQAHGTRVKATTSVELTAPNPGPAQLTPIPEAGGVEVGPAREVGGVEVGSAREVGRAAAAGLAGVFGVELHNSLRVRTYEDERDVAAIVDALGPDGLHVERWFPKAAVGGRVFDLRVVVIGGTATHAVVRTSTTPMTNLHLGGARGDLAEVVSRLGPERWAQALRVAERAAACFPGSPSVGVDLMVGANWRAFAVAEVNAFGDLLPRLTGLPGTWAEGLDTYTAQLVRAPLPVKGPPSMGGPSPAANPLPVEEPLPAAIPLPAANPLPVAGPLPLASPSPGEAPRLSEGHCLWEVLQSGEVRCA